MTHLRNVEIVGRRCDVTFGAILGTGGDDIDIDGRGGALLPGLHDHHLHLRAMAAARVSVDVRDGLDGLRLPPGSGWIRGIGGHDLTRAQLDAVVSDRPVRVQHRSGHAWVLNTAGLSALGLDTPDGLVVGDLPPHEIELDLAAIGAELAAYGITSVTDATPHVRADDLQGTVPQRVTVVRKVMAPAHQIPDAVHELRPGPVAVHCVTRAELVMALSVLGPGDRIEHAAVVPPELVAALPAVVTQPAFIAHRGDDYQREVDPADLPHLYRFRSLLTAGIPTVASSDAPFGPADPWAVIRAARDRRTASGLTLGPDERVTAATALDGYLRATPRMPCTTLHAGLPADLVLLHVPLAEALANPTSDHVRHTWVGGRLVR